MDIFFTICAFIVAALICYNFKSFPDKSVVLRSVLFVLVVRLVFFRILRTYASIIRYLDEKDLLRVVGAVSLGSVILIATNMSGLAEKNEFFLSKTFILAEYLLTLFSLVGYRIIVRFLHRFITRQNNHGIPTVIFGAGELGNITLRMLSKKEKSDFSIVACFDDNPKLLRKSLDGISVYEPESEFEKIVTKYDVKRAIFCIKNLSPKRKKELMTLCLNHHIQIMQMSSSDEWLNSDFRFGQIREVKVEELLSRPPIQLDKTNIETQIADQIILITGAAGSIGSEIARQITSFNPALLICLDQAESPLVELDLELKELFKCFNIKPIVANVTDLIKLEAVFKEYQPSIVFHAAAYKHVPMMEDNPREAVNVNVGGTSNIANLAVKYGAKKFVMISTDKAVNPTNVMGASKRIAEIYCQSLFYKTDVTQFITTRFGNVLGSNGSVIPRFKKQIEAGGPITVTDPEITRYFMTIPEACQLVLEAGIMGNGGEIFVFDMGEPVKILDLAERMIQLAGFVPYIDIDIKFSGLRPGEKLYEELLATKELIVETHHERIMKAKVREYDFDEVKSNINTLLDTAKAGSDMAIVTIMKQIVPEFLSDNSVFEILDKPKNKSEKIKL